MPNSAESTVHELKQRYHYTLKWGSQEHMSFNLKLTIASKLWKDLLEEHDERLAVHMTMGHLRTLVARLEERGSLAEILQGLIGSSHSFQLCSPKDYPDEKPLFKEKPFTFIVGHQQLPALLLHFSNMSADLGTGECNHCDSSGCSRTFASCRVAVDVKGNLLLGGACTRCWGLGKQHDCSLLPTWSGSQDARAGGDRAGYDFRRQVRAVLATAGPSNAQAEKGEE